MSTKQWISVCITGCLMAGLSAVPAAADVVTEWNAIALTAVAAGHPGPAGILDLAMVQIAVHDAIQAYQGRFESYNAPILGASGSPLAAAATAARDVLLSRVPSQGATVQAAWLANLASHGLLPTDDGVAVGQQAAINIIQRRANDGSFPANPEVFTGSTAIGRWRPTPPAFAPMANPWMGAVPPFALKDSEGVLPEPPPPQLTSGAYAKAYNEVKALGRRTNSARTAEQTDIGFFYSDNFLSQLNRAVQAIAIAHVTDIGDSARLFALANIAGADAIISAWNTKKQYVLWRPSTAILAGDADDNAATDADSGWLPLINDPPYPDYTSGANSITNAFMRTLGLYFGDDAFTFSLTTNVAQAVKKVRTYSRFSDVAADVVEARIYLGIHFRFADAVGRRHGKQAAERAFSQFLRPVS
ncbi:MAG TPA: vanadium-dependent haloperoxidase [Thermoanaerobaculia bacterium]|nr:vanadium-dependent haloperoxidase [Thermoanaerobaculia bacterium]